MHKDRKVVGLDRKPSIRSLAVKATSEAEQLPSELALAFERAQMLNHRIGECQVKALVQSRLARVSLDISEAGRERFAIRRITVDQYNLRKTNPAPTLNSSAKVDDRAAVGKLSN
jgi:hypothetical protein